MNDLSNMPGGDLLTAGVDLLGRTGAKSIQIRYCDEEEPTVWMAVAEYTRPEGTYFDTAAAMNPAGAVLRLVELMVDGGMCQHCKRPTAVEADFTANTPLDELFCWYVFDPERKTFRRSCES